MSKKDDKIFEKVQSNWDLFCSLVAKIKDNDVREALLKLCEDVGERMSTSPASSNLKYIGAFPGGLVWHSLEVLKIMKELNKIYGANIPTDSLILTALFHDLGKIGNKTTDLYSPHESDWHVNRGIIYQMDEDLMATPVPVRSLWWLSSYTSLSEDEIHAITSLQHMNQMYSSEVYNAPMLTLMLQQAVRAACIKNKGFVNVLEERK